MTGSRVDEPPGPVTLRREIATNVDDLYAKRITSEEFHVRQIAVWAEIAKRPRVHSQVLKMLRQDMGYDR